MNSIIQIQLNQRQINDNTKQENINKYMYFSRELCDYLKSYINIISDKNINILTTKISKEIGYFEHILFDDICDVIHTSKLEDIFELSMNIFDMIMNYYDDDNLHQKYNSQNDFDLQNLILKKICNYITSYKSININNILNESFISELSNLITSYVVNLYI